MGNRYCSGGSAGRAVGSAQDPWAVCTSEAYGSRETRAPMNSDLIKTAVLECGADLCGIAPLERFEGAPTGFHPKDIYEECESVVVFAKRLPTGSLFSKSCVPYTYANSLITQEVDLLTMVVSRKLGDLGFCCVPIPSDDPSEYWEARRSYARGILSLRHAGYAAGLGVLGRNTLLINERFGNMIQLGALLVDARLEGDSLANYTTCAPNCNRCIQSCPQSALDGTSVNQALCRPLSNYRNERGFILKKCNLCRKVCPHALGLKRTCEAQRDA
jgi:epoxyqueuosine reductase